jgi:hypothetical protein
LTPPRPDHHEQSIEEGESVMSKKIILITGASSGFGA